MNLFFIDRKYHGMFRGVTRSQMSHKITGLQPKTWSVDKYQIDSLQSQ